VSNSLWGQLAALGAALCWAFSSLLFAASGRRVGAYAVNLIRLLVALGIIAGLHSVLFGHPLPLDATAARWLWLGLSGLIGFALGDAALFQSLLYLGPRLGALMMALVPIITTFFAWVFLGERLAWVDLLAVALTVGGVGWVVAERRAPAGRDTVPVAGQRGLPASPAAGHSVPGKFRLGVLLGVMAATGQAVGLILSRQGVAADATGLELPVISANAIRLLVANAGLWGSAVVSGRAALPFQRLRGQARVLAMVVTATVFGPVVGVLLSLVAVREAPVGIASTLMALTPVLVIPMVRVLYAERVTARAVAGTVLALAGVALIFLA
jgi:drug/metabolite transporter (DMT)-like permease